MCGFPSFQSFQALPELASLNVSIVAVCLFFFFFKVKLVRQAQTVLIYLRETSRVSLWDIMKGGWAAGVDSM